MFESWIFDMDGLLAETESLWRIAEQEAADFLGLPLGDADFESTMGIRMSEVAQRWHDQFGWTAAITPKEVAGRVTKRVGELASTREAMPGVVQALDLAVDLGMKVGLCSSSDLAMIEAVISAIGLSDRFEVVHSAEHDRWGKPHPEPYLQTAELIGVRPNKCLVFEDTVTGCISAKAAGMKVIAVPAAHHIRDARFSMADVVLDSLEDLNADVITRMAQVKAYPSLARPRFHLAFEVDDLAAARHFYTQVLGCAEGRSAPEWIDFDLYGHQVVAHEVKKKAAVPETNPVDGQDVPARHAGVLLPVEAWDKLVARLQSHGTSFVIEPQTRFAGQVGEQRTCFLLDPAGNALEFKAFVDDTSVFAG